MIVSQITAYLQSKGIEVKKNHLNEYMLDKRIKMIDVCGLAAFVFHPNTRFPCQVSTKEWTEKTLDEIFNYP